MTLPNNQKTIDVSSALIIRENKILLGLRAPHKTYPNVWDMFGGHVENGETTEEALVRELQEELDIIVSKFTFLKSLEIVNEKKNQTLFLHVFRITKWIGDDPILNNNEHTKIKWFNLFQTKSLNLALPQYYSLFQEHIV